MDYVFGNEKAMKMVREVKVHFIDSFQHAAIEVKIALDTDMGCAGTISMPRNLPKIAPLESRANERYVHWAQNKWDSMY